MADPTPREILDRLVAFPTVSSRTNLPLIDWCAGLLEDHGARVLREQTGEKGGLIAHVGPEEAPVLLSGHTDVVPVEGQDWSVDPFAVTERGGRLYGRGTCDMKGFDALALHAMGRAAALHRDGRLRRGLQIALSRDEEVGCEGVAPLAALARDLPPPAATIVGEPTEGRVVTGHKGIVIWRVTVRGREVHSSAQPEGVSAVMEGARLIEWANRVNAAAEAAPSHPDYAPPHHTVNVGTFGGGTAHNITATEASMLISVRMMPGETAEGWRARLDDAIAAIEAPMKARAPETGFAVEELAHGPVFAAPAGSPSEALCRRLTGDNGTHTVAFGTEAGEWQAAGIDCAICGPGSIDQAHQPDEFITIPEFRRGEAFMDRLLDHLCED
ncbi:MAG: acetylornithine deacetylase [Hasllibacter sp.]